MNQLDIDRLHSTHFELLRSRMPGRGIGKTTYICQEILMNATEFNLKNEDVHVITKTHQRGINFLKHLEQVANAMNIKVTRKVSHLLIDESNVRVLTISSERSHRLLGLGRVTFEDMTYEI